jgi:cytochrome c oxidase subunit 3
MWFMNEAPLATYTIAEVQAGFKAHPEILIVRTKSKLKIRRRQSFKSGIRSKTSDAH